MTKYKEAQMRCRGIFSLTTGLILGVSILGTPRAYTASPQERPTPMVDVALQAQADQLRKDGAALAQSGNLRGAIDKFNAALTLYRQAHDLQGEAKSMYNLGLAYSNLYELQRALEHLNQALPLLQAAQEPAFEARALVNIGLIYQESAFKDDQKTLDYYLKALPLLHTAGTPVEEGRILQGVGDLYHRIGEIPKAIDHFKRALSVARLANDQETQVNVLSLLGLIYNEDLEYQPALEYYSQALTLLKGPGLQDRRTGILRLMGDISNNLGELAKALGYYNDALASARTARDPAKEADIYNALANFYMATIKDQEIARDYYKQALALWQTQAGDRATLEQARTLVSIGFVNFVLDEYDLAINQYNLALPRMETAGSLADQADLFTKLGDAYRWKRDYHRALDSYHKAVPLWRAARDHAGEVNTLRKLAFTYSQSGDRQRAQLYIAEVIPLIQTIPQLGYQAVLSSSVGLAYMTLDDPVQARNYYTQALQLYQTTVPSRLSEANALANIGWTYELQDNIPQALHFYQQSIGKLEAVRTAARLEELKDPVAAQTIDVYQRAMRLHLRLGQDAHVFDLSERARARTLLDQLGNSRFDRLRGVDPSLLTREQSLSNAVAELNHRRLQGDSSSDLKNQLATKQKEYDALLSYIKTTNPEYATFRSVDALNLAGIQNLLEPDVTLVSYFIMPDVTLAFIVTRDQFKLEQLQVIEQRLMTKIQGTHNSTSPSPVELQELYAALIKPIEPLLTTPKVGIIPHGVLHYLPFAALTADGKRYLGDDYTLFSLPSASMLRFILPKRKPTTGDALVMAYSSPGRGFSPLTYVNTEAQTIAGLYGTQPFTGSAATESALRRRAAQAAIIHLAAHGDLNPASALFSRILMGRDDDNDGSLTVNEVYGLDLQKAALVVLSACQTQVSARSRGDDLVGLTQAFIYAGAPAIIASLWKVDDQSTSDLMQAFYRNLHNGMYKAEALRVAQNETRGKYQSMRNWAAFVLVGVPD